MRFRVDIIESERGWGQKIDEQKFFTDANEAYKFVEEFNAKNTAPVAPDWYMQAQTPVRVD
jgi:Asp-tRNA(Asn)/Glu-tRNA(Gln) amidotransferase C subunit